MGSPAAAVGRQAASRVCSLRMLYLIYLRLGAEVGTISTPAGPDGNDLKSGGLAEEWLRVVAHQSHLRAVLDEYELAQREDAAWELAGGLFGTRKPGEYDKAVTLLVDLRGLSQREGRADAFAEHFRVLREQHPRKPSLLERFEKARLTP